MTTNLNLIGYRLAAAPPETIDRKPLALLAPLSTVHSNGGYFGRKWGVGRYVEAFAPGTTGVTFSRCTARKPRVVDVKQNQKTAETVSEEAREFIAAIREMGGRREFLDHVEVTHERCLDLQDAILAGAEKPPEVEQVTIPSNELASLRARLREAELLLIEARPAVALVQRLAEGPRGRLMQERAAQALANGAEDARAAK